MGDDTLGNVYKYFILQSVTSRQAKKFKVEKVYKPKEDSDWIRLGLTRVGRKSKPVRDRWVQISKSYDFLSYLLRDGAMPKDGFQLSRGKVIEALKCETCDGDGQVDVWFWCTECPDCDGKGDYINEQIRLCRDS